MAEPTTPTLTQLKAQAFDVQKAFQQENARHEKAVAQLDAEYRRLIGEIDKAEADKGETQQREPGSIRPAEQEQT